MFNDIDVTNADFLEACEELIPGFRDKLVAKLSERHDRVLLQRESCLSEDLDLIEKKINEETARLAELNAQRNTIQAELEAVHKEWIASHVVKSDEIAHNNDNPVRAAYKFIADNLGYDGNLKEFKRFDNLVHGRCNRTNIFNSNFDFTDILAIIANKMNANVSDADKTKHIQALAKIHNSCADTYAQCMQLLDSIGI